MILSWQSAQWEQLVRAQQHHRLPHALLFSGVAGIGKVDFALEFTHSILCQQKTNTFPCHQCHACHLIAGRVHPNVLWIEPEKVGQAIKVDQIREVIEFVNQSSLQDGQRVVLISPADNMNANAANALLKTLEEPSSGAIIILITHQKRRLPATILSRCQHIYFSLPTQDQALKWLKTKLTDANHDANLMLNLANGAPFAALQLMQHDILPMREMLLQSLHALSEQAADPVKTAAQLKELDLLSVLDFTLTWIIDLLRLQHNNADIVNKDYLPQLSKLSTKLDLQCNTQFMQFLQQLRSQICTGINFNKQLMLENIFIRWMECGAKCF